MAANTIQIIPYQLTINSGKQAVRQVALNIPVFVHLLYFALFFRCQFLPQILMHHSLVRIVDTTKLESGNKNCS